MLSSHLNRPGGRPLFVLGTVLSASMLCAQDAPPAPSEKVKKFLGDEVLEILAGTDKVEVFRIESRKALKEPTGEKIDFYPILAKGKDQGKEFSARLAAILHNETTYMFDVFKTCGFEPGVAFRLWKGSQWAVVLLCFNCDELEIITKATQAPNAKRPHEDFDPARPALVKLAKEALPDDKVIQALKDKPK